VWLWVCATWQQSEKIVNLQQQINFVTGKQ